MNSLREIHELESIVLQPLHRVNGDNWHCAPDGKWSIAQIIEHLALGVDVVARTLDHRACKAPMERRASPMQALARSLCLGLGKLPRGFQAPKAALPSLRPEPDLVTAQFRMGVAGLDSLLADWSPLQQQAVFVKHPLLGDLNLPEWVRFHFIHCRHHATQLGERLSWVRQQSIPGLTSRGRSGTRNR